MNMYKTLILILIFSELAFAEVNFSYEENFEVSSFKELNEISKEILEILPERIAKIIGDKSFRLGFYKQRNPYAYDEYGGDTNNKGISNFEKINGHTCSKKIPSRKELSYRSFIGRRDGRDIWLINLNPSLKKYASAEFTEATLCNKKNGRELLVSLVINEVLMTYLEEDSFSLTLGTRVGLWHEFEQTRYTASTIEGFLTDYEFACNYPGTYQILVREFGERVTPLCFSDRTVALKWKADLKIDLSPERLYAIQLQVVGPGTGDLISRYGHIMYRLIFCAPGREPSLECFQDTKHHYVVSFYGYNESEDSIDILGGLTGESTPHLNFYRAQNRMGVYLQKGQTVDSYTLKLSPIEKENFLKQAYELNLNPLVESWHHLKRNCAYWGMFLLKKSVLKEKLDLSREDIWEPSEVIPFLQSYGLL